jgi:hypothetical protein
MGLVFSAPIMLITGKRYRVASKLLKDRSHCQSRMVVQGRQRVDLRNICPY